MQENSEKNSKDEVVEIVEKSEKRGSVTALFLRAYWMFFGFIPPLVAVKMLLESKQFPSTGDLLFAISLLLIIFARFVDIRFLEGKRADFEPATMRDFYQFSLKIVLIFAFLWSVLRFVF